jgi:hypothetical protein
MALSSRLLKFWDPDRSLTALLVLLALNILVLSPASNLGKIVTPVAHLSLGLLFVAGILMMERGAFRIVALVVVCMAGATRLAADFFYDVLTLHIAAFAFASVAYALIIYVVARMVYAEGPVTGARIRGAVALYLLIAALFAVLYDCVELVFPGAFRFATGSAMTAAQLRDSLNYFSCVTLTTVGYGDLTAVHPFARSLVIFEALIGQLYPAILIARLVTLYEDTRRSGKKAGGGKTPALGK